MRTADAQAGQTHSVATLCPSGLQNQVLLEPMDFWLFQLHGLDRRFIAPPALAIILTTHQDIGLEHGQPRRLRTLLFGVGLVIPLVQSCSRYAGASDYRKLGLIYVFTGFPSVSKSESNLHFRAAV